MRPSDNPTTAALTDVERPVLVHDYLLVMRGAERTFVRMADIWPSAPIATLLYDHEVSASDWPATPSAWQQHRKAR